MPLLPFVPKTDEDSSKLATQSPTAPLAILESDPNLSSAIAHDASRTGPSRGRHPNQSRMLRGLMYSEVRYRLRQREEGRRYSDYRISSPVTDAAGQRSRYISSENSRPVSGLARRVTDHYHLARLDRQAFAPARPLSLERTPATPSSILGVNQLEGISIDSLRHTSRSPPPPSYVAPPERLRSDRRAIDSDNNSDNSEESYGSMPSLESAFHWEQRMDDGRRVVHIEYSSHYSPVSPEQGRRMESQPSQASPNAQTIPGAPPGWLGPTPNPTEAIRRLRDDPPEAFHITYAPGTALPVSSLRRRPMPATPRLEGLTGLPLHLTEGSRTSSHQHALENALARTHISEAVIPEPLMMEQGMDTRSGALQTLGLSRAAASQEIETSYHATLREIEERYAR